MRNIRLSMELKIQMSISNITSERLYRQACDYFYFLENTKFALLCIEKILNITPKHRKSWFLKGEIFLLENKIEEAVECFKKAEKYSAPLDNRARNLANIAVCYEMLEDYKKALLFCSKALDCICEEDYDFLPSLYQLQISSLIKLGHYSKAKRALKDFNSYLFSEDIHCLKMNLTNSIKEKVVQLKIAK